MVNKAAHDPDTAVDALPGRVLAGRYRVVSVLSTGANTIIADAVDLRAERPVTLKIVQPELAQTEEFRRAFRRCVEMATGLRHPNIAAVTDWGETDVDGESTVFWVVEHLAGGSLRELLDRNRLLTPSQALVVGLEACRALDAAHRTRIVHAEVTPSKLVFGVDGRLRIVDFAMARLLGAADWQDPPTLPTQVARYASPEQAQGRKIGPKTDVYALSLSLLEAVTGKVPFAADSTVATLSARIDKLLPVSADLGSLAAVLERAARPDPEDRSTAAEFGRGLVQAAGRLPRPEPVPVLSTGLFDSSELRRPSDPTGGFARPAAAAAGAVAGGAAVAAAGSTRMPGADGPADPPSRGTEDAGSRAVTAGEEPTGAVAAATAAAPDAAEDDAAPVEDVAAGDGVAGDAPAPDAAAGEDVAGHVDVAGDAPAPDAAAGEDVAGAAPAAVEDATGAAPGDDAAAVEVADGDAPGDDAAAAEAVDGDAPGDGVAAAEDASAADAAAAEVVAGDAPGDDDAAAEDASAEDAAAVEVVAGVGPAVGVAAAHTVPDDVMGADDVAPEAAAPLADGDEPVFVVADIADDAIATGAPAAAVTGVDTGSLPATEPVPVRGPTGVDTGSLPATEPVAAAIGGGVAVAATTERLPVPEPSAAPETERLPASAPPAQAMFYDEERPRRRWLPIFFVTLLVLAGIGALAYAGWLLLRTKSYEVPDLAGVTEQVALTEVEGNGWTVITERVRDDDFPEPDTVVRSDPEAGVMLEEGSDFTLVVSDGPEFRTLPELVDLPVDDVLGTLDGLALEGVEVPERVFSEDVPDGAVVSWEVQGNPSLTAGGQVLPGEVVLLTVSKGPQPRPAPNMVGLSVAEAAQAADAVQLGLRQGREVFSDTVPAGRVVSQRPSPDTPVERGGTVTVRVSKGPDLVPLPDIVQLPFARARNQLLNAGFTIGDVLGTTEGNIVAASVDGERADAGSTYRRGTPVDLISL